MEDDIVPLPVDEPPLEPIHQPMPEPEGGQAEQPTLQRQTRSGRVVRNTQRYAEGVQQRQQGLVAWETLVDQDDNELVPTAQQQYEIQQQLEDPVSFVASADPDTMYLNEAMSQPDRKQFCIAMDKELADHEQRQHWKVVRRSQVPSGTKIVNMIWSMKRKRRIDTREIYKWKARLNVHGGQQQYGINYWETYAPVVMWTTLWFFFVLSLLRGWHTRQLDFVLGFLKHLQRSNYI